jgi:NAD+-dependent protein deacetylase sirtuin 4
MYMMQNNDVKSEPLQRLIDIVADRQIVVLSGAGCSTDSGIPDYRGNGAPPRRAPVQYQEFVRSAATRARYWARSSIGWPRIRGALPNAAHHAIAQMERTGHVTGVITQNVDGLHHAAGTERIVELHGSLSRVRCLACGFTTSRDAFQQGLLEVNAGWPPYARTADVASAPDGDAELATEMLESFVVPDCGACGGIMKPHVVFFGENVHADVIREAWTVFEQGQLLLVIGSSLTVYSGRRFIDRAVRDSVPVAIVNRGPTRADDVAAVKIDDALGSVMPALARALATAQVSQSRAE